jgi:peptidoglycan hydrolase FlgJ
MIVSATNAGVSTAQKGERELAGAAKAFEAIFVRQMLAAARKTDFGGELFGGQSLDTFRQMQDERFADIAAESGAFGIAKLMEAQLSPSRLREGLGEGLLPSGIATRHQDKQALPRPLPQAGGEQVGSGLAGGGV